MTINFKQFAEALKGGQKKLDVNKNGKLEADDFKKLRKEEVELHPDAQKVLKHIKPEHHAKYTPDLTKKHYTGSYADRSAVLTAAEKAGHLKEQVALSESEEIDYESGASQRAAHEKKFGVKLTPKPIKDSPYNHAVSGEKANVKKFLTHHYGDVEDAKDIHPKAFSEEAKLDEAIDAEHYHATSEPSQFGGHRPKVVHKGKGTTMYLGGQGYKTKEAAKAGASAYLDAYAKIGDRAASAAAAAHAKKHPDAIREEVELDEAMNDDMHPAGVTLLKHIKPQHHNLYKPHLTTDVFNGSYKDRTDVLNAAKKAGHLKEESKLSYSMLIQALAEAKKQKDDEMEDMMDAEGEQGEQKISKRADTKPDSLGRKRKQAFKVHDGDSDGERLGEEVVEIEEGEVSKIEGGIRHKGTYGSEYETDRNGEEKKKAVVSAEKRGRGRPKKGSDSSGEVKKYTFNTLLNRLSTPSK